MKKLLIIALIGLTVVSCKKEDEETPTPAAASIEGNWTSTAQTINFTTTGIMFGIPIDSTESESTHPDSLDPKSIEIFPNGTLVITDIDDETDTTNYTHTGSSLSMIVPEGADDGSDTTIVWNIENLTANTMDLVLYVEEESFIDTTFFIDVTVSGDFTWSLSK